MAKQKKRRTQPRRRRSSNTDKVDSILLEIEDCNWSVADFLFHLFRSRDDGGEKIARGQRHMQMVTAFLNGATRHTVTDILDLLYVTATGVKYRSNDHSMPSNGVFDPNLETSSIRHAQPALHTWAVWTVTALIQKECDRAIDSKSGLRVRAGVTRTARKGPEFEVLVQQEAQQAAEGSGQPEGESVPATKTRRTRAVPDPLITWELIDDFSFHRLQDMFTENTPVMWHLLHAYSNPTVKQGRVRAVRKRRAQTLVSALFF